MNSISRRTFLSTAFIGTCLRSTHATGFPAFINDLAKKKNESELQSQLHGTTIHSLHNGVPVTYNNTGLGRIVTHIGDREVSQNGLHKALSHAQSVGDRKQIVFDFTQNALNGGGRNRTAAVRPLEGQVLSLVDYDPYTDTGIKPVTGVEMSYNGEVVTTDDQGRFLFSPTDEDTGHELIGKTPKGLMNIKYNVFSKRPLDFFLGSSEDGHRWNWDPEHLSGIHNPTTQKRPSRWAHGIGNTIGSGFDSNTIPVFFDRDNAPAGDIATLQEDLFEANEAVNDYLAQFNEGYWTVMAEIPVKFDLIRAQNGNETSRGLIFSWNNPIAKFEGIEYDSDPNQPNVPYLIAGHVKMGTTVSKSNLWHEGIVFGHSVGRNHLLVPAGEGSCMTPSTGPFTFDDVRSLVALYSAPNYANINEGLTLENVEPTTDVHDWKVH